MADLFQKSALEEQAAPEQLNQQLRIMKPHMWILFLILVIAFSGCSIWAFFGTVSSTTAIEGIVFPQMGVERIVVPSAGIVQDVLYQNGEVVQRGDILAVVPNKECLEVLSQCRDELAAAKSEQDRQVYEEKLQELEDVYEQTSLIRASSSGTLQNMISINEQVEAGDEAASILISNAASNSREIIGYLPMTEAKKLQIGMEAQVCPSYVQREEYGYMRGYISSIGTMPVTQENLEQYYGNLEYIKDILPDTSCVEIRIAMYVDENSQNHFAWSNERGNELAVDIGTVCEIQIVTEQKHPAELFWK